MVEPQALEVAATALEVFFLLLSLRMRVLLCEYYGTYMWLHVAAALVGERGGGGSFSFV